MLLQTVWNPYKTLFIYDKYGEHCPRNDCKTNGICQKEPDFFTDIFLFIP